ncbi:PREDICTED: PR domain zinc finger protein 5-like isoform X2 [Papilio polytes]|uniref:PR domain zinc finger protein 5-like isoform X2 n=1 Tax=Papilio polytes TaxID=76194 RepID=UPI0006768FFA|nr:PREDICTED: PR domain zinc finger protein 5-like isoform X2 [Papilio polytes]
MFRVQGILLFFSTYNEMVQHYDKMHPQFTCDQCGATCRSKKAIESHIKFRHLPSVCDVCGRLCSSGTAVDSHKRLHHPKKRNSVTELSYCVECNMQFDNVYKYKKHLYHAVAHKPRVPIKVPCPGCDRIFSSKRSSNNHYNLVHLKKTKHYCQLCDKYFARSCALRNHRQRIHERKHLTKDKM